MLNRAKLTNFRQHRDLDVTFKGGMTAILGHNEAGKSTLLEGAAYAILGVSALRESLEDVVTWGEPVGSLKVELLPLIIDGVEYNVKRSKSGAEVVYDGGRVTGQNEVTKFLCDKLGIEAKSAAKLILSNQGEIRGALAAGAKATTDLIERLAEFDQIDRLIENMQENLSLGSATTLETQLAKVEEDLVAAKAAAVKPDFDKLNSDVDAAKAAHQQAREALAALDDEHTVATTKVDQARAAQSKFEQAQANLENATLRLSQFSMTLESAQAAANNVKVWEKTEAQVDQEIANLEQADLHIKAYGRVVKLLQAPDEVVEGYSFTGLQAYIADLAHAEKLAQTSLASTGSSLYLAKSALTSGTCSWCGQDFSHLPEVAEKNAKAQAEVDRLTAVEQVVKAKLKTLEEDLAEAHEVVRLSQPRISALQSNPQYLERVGETLPPTLKWIGPDLDSLGDPDTALDAARRLRSEMRATISAEAAAKTRYETLLAQRPGLEEALANAKVQVEATELRPNLDEALARRDEVLAKRRPLELQASNQQTVARDAEYALRDAERTFTQATQKVEHLEEAVIALKHQLKTLAFNNALLKRVRQCRPAIADKLWSIVLSSVSSYFSELRGKKSRVTKDADGFKVDGHATEGLSGSTLDILGLAIRVALVRTFLPNAPFLVLDEPCAAMDATRTEATLGFVVACGFKQVLLVTHEDTSESVADHIIQL